MLPAYGTHKELDESIEVEVGPIKTAACASSSSYAPSLTAPSSDTRSDNDTAEDAAAEDERSDNYVGYFPSLSSSSSDTRSDNDASEDAAVEDERCDNYVGFFPSLTSSSSEARSDTDASEDAVVKDERVGDDVVTGITSECIIEAQEDTLQCMMEIEDEEGPNVEYTNDECAAAMDNLEFEYNEDLHEIANNMENLFTEMPTSSTSEVRYDVFGNATEEVLNIEGVIDVYVDVIDTNEDCFRHACKELNGVDDKDFSEHTMTVKRMALLEDDVAAKQYMIDEMTKTIVTLEKKVINSADLVEQIQLLKHDNARFDAENRALIASNKGILTVLEGEKCVIDKLTLDISNLNTKCDEISSDNAVVNERLKMRTADNADLTERLQQSKAKTEGLESEVKFLISNNKAAQLFKAKNDRLEIEVQSLVASNKANVQQIAMLEDDLEAKKSMIVEMSVEIDNKSKSFEEKSVEICDLSKQLQISKDTILGLEEEIRTLVASNKENYQQINTLEEDLVAKKIMIAEICDDIQHKSNSLTDKTAEVVDITEKLQISLAHNERLEAKVESLTASSKESAQQLILLEDDLAPKIIMIEKMSEEIQHKNVSLEEKSTEIANLAEQLQLSKAERDRLNSEVVSFITSNKENIDHIILLKDDVAVKESVIEKMTIDILKFNTENTALSEQLELSKAEQDVLKTTIQDLESKNNNFVSEIENHTSSMQDLVQKNEALQLRVQEVSVANKKLGDINNASEEKIVELQDAVEREATTLENSRATYEGELEEMKRKLEVEEADKADIVLILQEKTNENVDLADRLQLSNAMINGLEAEVQTLVVHNKDTIQQMTVLEDDVEAKKSMIDAMSMNINNLNSTLENMTTKNTALCDRIELYNIKIDGLNRSCQDLVSKNDKYAIEVKKLTSSLKEANTWNEMLQLRIEEVAAANNKHSQVSEKNKITISELHGVVEHITKSLNDERSDHDKQIVEMTHVMENLVRMSEESLRDVTSKISAKNMTIADLAKSLDEAKIEIHSRDILLDKKIS